MTRPSDEQIAKYVTGARKVLADELPAGHKLWKSWALDLADDVLAINKRLAAERAAREQAEQALREAEGLLWMVAVWFGNGQSQTNPYVARDLGLVNAWVNARGLTDSEEGREKAKQARAALAALRASERLGGR